MILKPNVCGTAKVICLRAARLACHGLGQLDRKPLVGFGSVAGRGNSAVAELFLGLQPILQIAAGFASAFLPNVICECSNLFRCWLASFCFYIVHNGILMLRSIIH